MLSRDLIATVVKTFFEELGEVRDGGRQINDGSLYAGFYSTYFSRDREYFLKAPVAEITAFLADDPIKKLEMLAELLYRDGSSLTNQKMQRVIYQKVLELYDVIDLRSMEFSMERMKRIAELKQELE